MEQEVKWIWQNTWCYQSRFPTLIRLRSRRLGGAEDGARLSSRQWDPGPKPEAGIVRERTFKDLGKEGVYFTSGGIEVICGQGIDCRDCHKFFNTSFLERCDMYSVALLLEFWLVLSLPWSLQYHRSDVMPVFRPNSKKWAASTFWSLEQSGSLAALCKNPVLPVLHGGEAMCRHSLSPTVQNTSHMSEEAILDSPEQPFHQQNTTKWPLVMPRGTEALPRGDLPEFLTHKIERYNKMVVVL